VAGTILVRQTEANFEQLLADTSGSGSAGESICVAWNTVEAKITSLYTMSDDCEWPDDEEHEFTELAKALTAALTPTKKPEVKDEVKIEPVEVKAPKVITFRRRIIISR
jgi:hypothetical protein